MPKGVKRLATACVNANGENGISPNTVGWAGVGLSVLGTLMALGPATTHTISFKRR